MMIMTEYGVIERDMKRQKRTSQHDQRSEGGRGEHDATVKLLTLSLQVGQ